MYYTILIDYRSDYIIVDLNVCANITVVYKIKVCLFSDTAFNILDELYTDFQHFACRDYPIDWCTLCCGSTNIL